jgi:hypothetical protein
MDPFHIALGICVFLVYAAGRRALSTQARQTEAERREWIEERAGLMKQVVKVALSKTVGEYVASEDETPCRTWQGDSFHPDVDPDDHPLGTQE